MYILGHRLDHASDLVGLQTFHADLHFFGAACCGHAGRLKVWNPSALGLLSAKFPLTTMVVADVLPKLSSFAAY